MKYTYLFLLVLVTTSFSGPPNCNIYTGDCKLACHEAEKAVQYGQGTFKCQEHFLKSIELCPSFDYSYFEMSVPYAKRGFMKEWKILIDAAVNLDPKEHLPTRAWYHYFFMHNYEAAIKDINAYDLLVDYDIGHTGDAYYHLNIMKGLCYKGMGDAEKAIAVMNDQLSKEDHFLGVYDYLHLGVCYLENKQPKLALEAFKKQKEAYDIAEIYFYSARAFNSLKKNKEVKRNFQLALEYYDLEKTMNNPYRQLNDEIYRSEILEEISSAK